MRNLFRTTVFVLALSCLVYGGEIQNGVTVAQPQPTPTPTSSQEATEGEPQAAGEIQNGQPDAVTEAALSLLGSLLALF